eukprot:3465709-Rhodomonas_salina.1
MCCPGTGTAGVPRRWRNETPLRAPTTCPTSASSRTSASRQVCKTQRATNCKRPETVRVLQVLLVVSGTSRVLRCVVRPRHPIPPWQRARCRNESDENLEGGESRAQCADARLLGLTLTERVAGAGIKKAPDFKKKGGATGSRKGDIQRAGKDRRNKQHSRRKS